MRQTEEEERWRDGYHGTAARLYSSPPPEDFTILTLNMDGQRERR